MNTYGFAHFALCRLIESDPDRQVKLHTRFLWNAWMTAGESTLRKTVT